MVGWVDGVGCDVLREGFVAGWWGAGQGLIVRWDVQAGVAGWWGPPAGVVVGILTLLATADMCVWLLLPLTSRLSMALSIRCCVTQQHPHMNH